MRAGLIQKSVAVCTRSKIWLGCKLLACSNTIRSRLEIDGRGETAHRSFLSYPQVFLTRFDLHMIPCSIPTIVLIGTWKLPQRRAIGEASYPGFGDHFSVTTGATKPIHRMMRKWVTACTCKASLSPWNVPICSMHKDDVGHRGFLLFLQIAAVNSR